MHTRVRPRREIPAEHTWDATSVFGSDGEWEAAFATAEAQLPAIQRFCGTLGDGPARLAEWFDVSQDHGRLLGRVMIYANMGHQVDTTDQDAAARHDRARALVARAAAASAFADPELMAVGFDTLRRWLEEEPRLAPYAHHIDKLRRRQAHVRSPEVEELLALLADPFRSAAATHGILTDADLSFAPARTVGTGEPIEVVQGNLSALLSQPDREVRRTAWENYADAHLRYRNTMANSLATGVKQNVFLARARRYPSALEASVAPHSIPAEVFHNLIATYRKHLPIWHRYWRIRRSALGYERLHSYDRLAPLTTRKRRVPFGQAVMWICDGMRPLDDEYVAIMRRGLLEQRWVDVYPNTGKRAGAFSAGAPGTHPFILMSYNDDLYSASTLAHELGHSMHSYYAWRAQPFIYARYPIFLAEVASNFNQAMVRAHLLDTEPDPEFQVEVIEEAMANFYRYFLVMPTLARFELEIHERVERGQALTAAGMTDLMADLFHEAFGGEVEIDRERVGITWAQFSAHLYMNFYVYQYATGIAGAHTLAQRVLSQAPGAAGDYLAFLKAGGSKYPLDAVRLAGVDLASPEPVERTFGILASLVETLDGLLSRRRTDPI